MFIIVSRCKESVAQPTKKEKTLNGMVQNQTKAYETAEVEEEIIKDIVGPTISL